MGQRRHGWTRRLRGEVRESRAREVLGRRRAGVPPAEFCRSEGISPTTLARWRREFGENGQGGSGTGPARADRFVRVELGEPSGGALEVELRSGVRVRVPLGFDAGDLVRLLALLEPSAC